MKREDNNGLGSWLVIAGTAAVLWLLMIFAKCAGACRHSWLVVLLGCLWIAPVLIITALVAYKLNDALQQLYKRRKQRKMIRDIRETMAILTMNSVGGVFGVKRQPGESNRHFQRRINRAAIDHDNAERRAPAPATGAKLDRIAGIHGLTRKAGETDAELQERIRRRIYEKLEAGET